MLIPEADHSFFEEFESLVYAFSLPILVATWLHTGASAISWKQRPHQLHSSFPPSKTDCSKTSHPPRDMGSCGVLERAEGLGLGVLSFKTYMTLGKSLSFSEPQAAHL